MGIGRRDFLKLFGATLATIAIAASPAATLLDDLYINRKLGIAFRKYRGWHFSNVADMGMVKDGQILALDDLDLAEQLKEKTELPLISISKEPILSGAQDFTPGINVYLERYVLTKDGKMQDPYINIQKDILYCGEVLKNFEVVSEPMEIYVSNCRTVEYVSSFLFEHVNLMAPTLVRMDSLSIVQEPAWYTFRMFDSPYYGIEKTIDYSEFVDSIQII